MDDHITWLLDGKKYKEAYNEAIKKQRELKIHEVLVRIHWIVNILYVSFIYLRIFLFCVFVSSYWLILRPVCCWQWSKNGKLNHIFCLVASFTCKNYISLSKGLTTFCEVINSNGNKYDFFCKWRWRGKIACQQKLITHWFS